MMSPSPRIPLRQQPVSRIHFMIVDSLRVYLPKTVHDHGSAPGVRSGVGRVVSLRFWGLVVSARALRIGRGCRVHVV